MEKTEEKKSVVFVCTGNTCRSPMAEVVFRSELKRRKIEYAEGFSAGIAARGNGEENINLKSVSVLNENGLSVENFHARRLNRETLEGAFAIVCMTDEQRDFLMDLRWDTLRKEGKGGEEIENNVYSFSDLCGYQIPDPYGKDLDAYRETFRLISAAMPPLFSKFFPETEEKKEEQKPAPKKRGRPKKTPEQKAADEKRRASEKANTPPKKRGRPKKNTAEQKKEQEIPSNA